MTGQSGLSPKGDATIHSTEVPRFSTTFKIQTLQCTCFHSASMQRREKLPSAFWPKLQVHPPFSVSLAARACGSPHLQRHSVQTALQRVLCKVHHSERKAPAWAQHTCPNQHSVQTALQQALCKVHHSERKTLTKAHILVLTNTVCKQRYSKSYAKSIILKGRLSRGLNILVLTNTACKQ